MADSQRICSIEGCSNPAATRGMCNSHYLRWRRHGSPYGGSTSTGAPLRFLSELAASPPNECVPWPFASNGNGYGWAWYLGKRMGAHRASLILATGEDQPGLDAAHLCHNRICVNPKHLEWQTRSENLKANFSRNRKNGTA